MTSSLPSPSGRSILMANCISRIAAIVIGVLSGTSSTFAADLETWEHEFPKTNFAKTSVPLDEILDDGNFRDTIAPIDKPVFQSASALTAMGPLEPVLSVMIGEDARAYPLRMLLWHEIVNDTVGGIPLLISYCPLCNSGVVFDRRVDGKVLRFGNTGRIRHFDMVMYDHENENWWQQFTGEAIIGDDAGRFLKPVPARLESLARFRARAPRGRVMIPDDVMRQPYGATAYYGMDSLWETQSKNMLRERYPYGLPADISPLLRVVVVEGKAWSVELLRRVRRIEDGETILIWQEGQNSVHDNPIVSSGRDVGNVIVQRAGLDIPYDVVFAFAFRAFWPDGEIVFSQ